MTQINLEMFRGRSQQFDLTITKDGAPLNVTGWRFWLTVKARPADADADAIFQVTDEDFSRTNPTVGLVSCLVRPAKTAALKLNSDRAYFFDVQGTDGGEGVYSVAGGQLTIHPTVTEATS
jgi:hypothetical protein